MLRRLLFVTILLCLVVQPVVSHADMGTIFDSLKALNGPRSLPILLPPRPRLRLGNSSQLSSPSRAVKMSSIN